MMYHVVHDTNPHAKEVVCIDIPRSRDQLTYEFAEMIKGINGSVSIVKKHF